MDALKKLKLEFNGIKSVIREYTSEGNISNYITGLEDTISKGDGEGIVYYLNEIATWYDRNISKILSNEYVFNKESHERNKKLVTELYKNLKEYDFSAVIADKLGEDSNPFIFLSHCSANKKYADALETLLSAIGLKESQLIYTSHPLHKIPLDENIYDFLRTHINRNVFVIILWSNEYLESPACLNEMGAAWVVQADYTNMYTPDFAFGNPKYHQCAVDTRKMGAVLNGDDNCKASMTEFKDKIVGIFDLSVDEKKWINVLDSFLESIK